MKHVSTASTQLCSPWSQWWTHVSSPVKICRTNLTGSDSKASTISWAVVTRRAWSWCQLPRDPSCRHLWHLQMIMDYGFHASTRNMHCSRNLQYFYSPVIFNQFLHSSNYRWINSVRRPAGPQVIFERLTSTTKLIWPSGNCAVRRCTAPIHTRSRSWIFFAARPSLQKNLMTARKSNFKFSITMLSCLLCCAMTSS